MLNIKLVMVLLEEVESKACTTNSSDVSLVSLFIPWKCFLSCPAYCHLLNSSDSYFFFFFFNSDPVWVLFIYLLLFIYLVIKM